MWPRIGIYPLGAQLYVPSAGGGSTQLQDSLVAYWLLGEASGTRNDSFGTNHLAANGSVGQVTGKQGNAATFSRASAQSLTCNDNAALSLNGTSWSIAFWARMASKPVDGDGNMAAVSKWDYNTSNREYSIGYNASQDRFNLSVASNGTTQTHLYATASGSPSINTWYFIVAWYDTVLGTLNIQVNNGPVTSVAYTAGIFNGAASFGIGAMAASNDLYWNGDIDEVGIWKRVLTASERTTLHNAGAGTTYPLSDTVPAFAPSHISNLLAWWDAGSITGLSDGAAVATWNDSSANALHLNQTTSGRRPLYRASGPNSKPYIEFVGANSNCMVTSAVSGNPAPWTLFWVLNINQLFSSGPRIWENDNATTTVEARVRMTAGGIQAFVNASTAGPSISNTGAVLQNTWMVLTARMSTAAQAHVFYNNNTRSTAANDMSAFTPSVQVVGASSNSGGNAISMYLAEKLIYAAEVSATDEMAVVNYLSAKYGGLF